MRAPWRASSRQDQNPISRNDRMLVSSQQITSSSRLSASTTPSMAAMNSSSRLKKRTAEALRGR
ncbi:hypothetical protein D3C72_2560540 [compost metagenome]